MGKILCIKRDLLFHHYYLNGFISDCVDFNKQIQNHWFYKERNLVENDFSIKQIVPYIMIIDQDKNQVFCYKRKGNEKRLHDKISLGFGGHVEQSDKSIQIAAIREVKEETTLENFEIKEIGFLNLDSDEVSQVHFGVVFVVFVDREKVQLNGDENKSGAWLDINKLDKVKFETWSECLKIVLSKQS